MMPRQDHDIAGFSMMELLVSICIIGIVVATAVSNLKELNDPLSNAGFAVGHYLRLARSRAISQTLAIQVAPVSATVISASSSDSCENDMTPMTDLAVELPTGTRIADLDWSICFTPRGFSPENVLFEIIADDGNRKTVEISLGGGARVE